MKSATYYIKWFGDAEATARYSVVSNWIRKNRGREVLNILDVGGGWRSIYPEIYKLVDKGFVNLTSVDVDFEDKKMFTKVNYTKLMPGDKLPFKDNSFDLVFSLDAFEHVFPKQRKSFMTELLRVCAKDCILSFPTGKYSFALDKELYNFSKEYSKEVHRFFKEHLENGLPDITDYHILFKKEGFSLVEELPKHSLYFRRIFMKLWIVKPLLYKIFSPLILITYLFFNFGKCYRTYYFFKKV